MSRRFSETRAAPSVRSRRRPTSRQPLITLANPTDVIGLEIGDWVQTAPDNGTATAPLGVNGGWPEGQGRGAATQSPAPSPWVPHGPLIPSTAAGISSFAPATMRWPSRAWTAGFPRRIRLVASPSWVWIAAWATSFARLVSVTSATAGSKEECLLDAAAKAANLSSMLRRGYVNPLDYNDLVKEVGSKRFIDSKTREVGIGFKGIELYTAAGTLEIVADAFCKRGTAKLVDPDDITLRTAGECPNPLNWGGAQSTSSVGERRRSSIPSRAYGEFAYEMNNIPVHVTF